MIYFLFSGFDPSCRGRRPELLLTFCVCERKMARRKSTRTKTPTKTRRKPAFDADAFVRDVFANPETEVKRDDAAVNKCRQLLGHIFAIQSSAAYGEDALKLQFAPKDKKDVPLGPLTRLEVGAVFDYDQLWEELEMRNVPVYQHIMKNVREQKEVNDRPAPETESAQDEDVVTDAAGNEVVPMDGLLEREMDESSGEEVMKMMMMRMVRRMRRI